jgi:DUF1680 family protein
MMHLAYADGKYVDLYEESLYNNVIGTMDTAGNNFEYTNPLDQNWARGNWHACPCCVGNFPRTVLTLPSWMYSKRNSPAGLYVNLYVGSTVSFSNVFGTTDITLTQATNYPFDGNVTLTVSPSAATAFTLYVRSSQRSVSTIYTHSPSSDGISSLTVNGVSQSTTPSLGYVAINRTWAAGDQVVISMPMNIQRVKAISNVAACTGRVAIQRGPVIYNIENIDNGGVDVNTRVLPPSATLSTSWNATLFSGGTQVVTSTFSGGSAMLAIPHYRRCNRGGRSIVWIKDA